MIKVRAISVHFHHFWIWCYREHSSVGLVWGYRLELSPSNTRNIFALPMQYSCISVITQNKTPCTVLWDLTFFLWLLELLFSEFYFTFSVSLNFSFFSDLILIVIFSRTYIFFGTFMFFFRLQNPSQTCKFLFLDLYVFPNLFFLRSSIVWKKYAFEKIQVRK